MDNLGNIYMKPTLGSFNQDQMIGTKPKIDIHASITLDVYMYINAELSSTISRGSYLLNVFSDGILASTLANLSNICTTKALGILGKSPEINIFGDG